MQDGTVRVVLATDGLGMAVDMAGVNTIIHYGAPSSIDGYFQESGRAGWSGDQASSVVYRSQLNVLLEMNQKRYIKLK